ncbi:hypothetical protein C1Y63_12415 [Corynebacterium sp. 13CS0277]|nr:hypothetical protein C1Y63_12415 [Corynebacterium sp. 13CS0277]
MPTTVDCSEVLPAQQSTSSGNPRSSASNPTMTCGSTRCSLDFPRRRSSSSLSTSKYKVVTS